jgi:lipopolysaccharide export system permease protein
MRFGSRLIERYVVKAIFPYLLLSLSLLTMILFVQQSSRFTDLLLATRVPLSLLTEVAASLLPNVLAFTLPMATLAGTVIGLSRLNSDSELVAMRAAGASDLKILWPVLLIGLLLSAGTFYINFELSPESARALRRTGIQAALRKLDSPVEPRTFNANIPGYVVYVRDGDKAQGRWERVFIYAKDRDGATRLITARSGRIDSMAEQSELVLSDAVATTIPSDTGHGGESQYVTEKLSQLRVVLETGRKGLLERLRKDESDLDEMRLSELVNFARTRVGQEGREAATLLHRRLSLSLAPAVFALLGASLCLHVGRGGRGWGSLLSLMTLLIYYMVSLLGEQLARKGTVPPPLGVWSATAISLIACIFLFFSHPRNLLGLIKRPVANKKSLVGSRVVFRSGAGMGRLLGFPGLLDISLLRSLLINCSFAYISLLAIFLIFTLFELWRFINPARTGMLVVARYLFFLMPLATVQLLPAGLLIAVLATYALMSRRSEAVAWWASGQSVYRLMLPGLVFALIVGLVSWGVQEKLMPQANLLQDALRAAIKGGVARTTSGVGRQWLASASAASGRLYSYGYDEGDVGLSDPAVYEFDAEGVHLRRIIVGRKGTWPQSDNLLSIAEAEVISLEGGGIERVRLDRADVAGSESPEMFKLKLNKPAHLNAKELSDYIKAVKPSGRSVASLLIALQRKYADPPAALTMALFGIPLALSFGRRSAIAALCSAVAIGLAFWGTTAIFQQLGEYGLLPPPVAVWSPMIMFAAVGVYLLTRMKT